MLATLITLDVYSNHVHENGRQRGILTTTFFNFLYVLYTIGYIHNTLGQLVLGGEVIFKNDTIHQLDNSLN